MTIEPEGVEVYLMHPWELGDAEWFEIARLAQKYALAGEENFMKCCVMAYVEWISIDSIEGMKQ